MLPGKAFDPQWLLNNGVSNTICVLVFGDRFEYTNYDFQSLLKNMNEVIFLEGGIWAQVIYLHFQLCIQKIKHGQPVQ